MRAFILTIILCFFIIIPNQASSIKLVQICRKTLEYQFQTDKKPSYKRFVNSFSIIAPEYKKKNGLFITLSYNGQTRACWGSIQAQYPDLIKATIYTTFDALNKEYRYKPIQKAEISNLRIQITVIEKLEPLKNIQNFNPLIDGLLLRQGGRSAIILPKEFIDSHYALVQIKLKAGIRNNENNYQLYKLKARIYEE